MTGTPTRSTEEGVSQLYIHLTLIDLYFRCKTDPLIHHGRHFARAVHAFAHVHTLITRAMARDFAIDDAAAEKQDPPTYTAE